MEKYFKFLDELREEGTINMWGASTYLYEEFSELSTDESRDILIKWMDTFDERHPSKEKNKMKNECIVVNLAGAPGAGKSTASAYIFSKLKMNKVNVELVTEYAKRKVWEENSSALSNQAYVFGHQYYSMDCCAKNVDVIITDSPLFLSAIYNSSDVLGDGFNKVVMNVFNSFNNKNYFLKRVQPYDTIGRIHTEEESNMIEKKLINLLDLNHIKYKIKDGNETNYDEIANEILEEIKTKKIEGVNKK